MSNFNLNWKNVLDEFNDLNPEYQEYKKTSKLERQKRDAPLFKQIREAPLFKSIRNFDIKKLEPFKSTLDFRYVYEDKDVGWSEINELNNNSLLMDIIRKNNINGNYRLIIKSNDLGKLIDKEYVIDSNFWKNHGDDFRVNSENMIWNYKINDGDIIYFIFTKEKRLSFNYYQQRFLDGINHCFFEPIYEYFNDVIDNTKSKSTKLKYTQKINIIKGKKLKSGIIKIGLEEEYKKGIPECDIGIVCEKLQIGVDIEQPFNTNKLFEYRSNKKSLKVFKYLNTRLNHLEENEKSCNFDNIYKGFEPIKVDKHQLLEIQKELNKTQELCIFNKNSNGISSIRTLNNFYMLDDNFYDVQTEFEKETGLNYCSIDALKYPYLQDFIDNSIHYNGTIDFKDTSIYRENKNIAENIKHIDMNKAYTQFKKSKYYTGFCGKITDFRKVDNYKQKGFYFIENLDLSNCNEKFKNLNDVLIWFQNKNIYTDAELTALKENGGKFNVISGAFGLNIDFEFSDAMKNNKVEIELNGETIKIPYYSKYCGLITKTDKTKSFYMKGEKEFFESINDNTLSIFMPENDNNETEARISFNKKYIYNKKHITAQITAYQRLNMLEQLLKMDYNKLIRICVDGIYFEDHKFNIDECFSYKEKMTFKNAPHNEYLNNLILLNSVNSIKQPQADTREFYKKELFKGAGGNGKTYYNLFIDKGLINPVYVAHSWKLATTMKNNYFKEFNKILDVSVHCRLYIKPYCDSLINKYSNYIIDECSMITEEEKEQIFKINGKVILCGDIGFQLEPVNIGEQMNESGFDNITEFKKNYRFKSKKIKSIIDFVRININKNIDYKNIGLQTIKKNKIKNIYNHQKDIILRFHNELKDTFKGCNYTEHFKELKKYKVLENTRDYKNGEIIFDDIKIKKELRHAYTVHSVQGESYKGNIFIDIKGFDNKLFYTAISRTEYFKQIYLIE